MKGSATMTMPMRRGSSPRQKNKMMRANICAAASCITMRRMLRVLSTSDQSRSSNAKPAPAKTAPTDVNTPMMCGSAVESKPMLMTQTQHAEAASMQVSAAPRAQRFSHSGATVWAVMTTMTLIAQYTRSNRV